LRQPLRALRLIEAIHTFSLIPDTLFASSVSGFGFFYDFDTIKGLSVSVIFTFAVKRLHLYRNIQKTLCNKVMWTFSVGEMDISGW